ncbi:MAG: hypothetical protein HFF36_09675 [Coprobacillus sp.]|nr:hypothetical protein [Coprobacillus sp.]
MSKYQEALDRIMNDDYDFPNDYYGEDRATAMDRDEETLQELIERATSKKVTIDTKRNAHCPICGEIQVFGYYDVNNKYCPKCGQALDWSEE